MDLSQEKILFESSRAPLWLFLLLMIFFIVEGIWNSSLFEPRGTYYDMDSFLLFCACTVCSTMVFLGYKARFVERFYIVEDGVIVRNGFSGKWYRLGFANIESVVHVIIPEVGRKPGYHSIVILCKNHAVLSLPPWSCGATDRYRVADLLKDRNLPLSICTTREELKKIMAGYTSEKAEEWQEAYSPFLVALHYYVTFLPLFAAVCLCIAGVLNAYCGIQKDVVVRGTIAAEKTHRPSKILVSSSQGELWFPVNSNLIGQLHIDEQLEVHYKEGCVGVDYGLTFKKIK